MMYSFPCGCCNKSITNQVVYKGRNLLSRISGGWKKPRCQQGMLSEGHRGDLFSAFPLGFWCSQPAWHALAGGYCSPVSASIITWPLSSLCVHMAVFLPGHRSYGIGTHPTPATTPFPNKITFQDYGKDHSFGRTLFNPIHGTRSRLPWWLRQ